MCIGMGSVGSNSWRRHQRVDGTVSPEICNNNVGILGNGIRVYSTIYYRGEYTVSISVCFIKIDCEKNE